MVMERKTIFYPHKRTTLTEMKDMETKKIIKPVLIQWALQLIRCSLLSDLNYHYLS